MILQQSIELLKGSGLEGLMKHLKIKDGDLEFMGQVFGLRYDPRVRSVMISNFAENYISFSVCLNNERQDEDRISLLRDNGFPEPSLIRKRENPESTRAYYDVGSNRYKIIF